MQLSEQEKIRYRRHLGLKEIGEKGQIKLKNASVLLVGVGGLGSATSLYLAAAGVGRIGLIDFDIVSYSNLQRQVIYNTEDSGKYKVEVASKRLRALNPEIEVTVYSRPLQASNALEIISQYDLVIDGADNFATRYLVNDACYFSKTPNVSASVMGFEGRLSIYCDENGPCYRCLYPEPPPEGAVPSCGDAGILGVIPGIFGTLQASETLKLILGVGQPLVGQYLMFNVLDMKMSKLPLKKQKNCPLCGENPKIDAIETEKTSCKMSPQRDLNQMTPRDYLAMSKKAEYQLIDVRRTDEYTSDHIEGSMLVPYEELGERYREISSEKPLLVYCRTGRRSCEAAHFLISKGYNDVTNLVGGLEAIREFENL